MDDLEIQVGDYVKHHMFDNAFVVKHIFFMTHEEYTREWADLEFINGGRNQIRLMLCNCKKISPQQAFLMCLEK